MLPGNTWPLTCGSSHVERLHIQQQGSLRLLFPGDIFCQPFKPALKLQQNLERGFHCGTGTECTWHVWWDCCKALQIVYPKKVIGPILKISLEKGLQTTRHHHQPSMSIMNIIKHLCVWGSFWQLLWYCYIMINHAYKHIHLHERKICMTHTQKQMHCHQCICKRMCARILCSMCKYSACRVVPLVAGWSISRLISLNNSHVIPSSTYQNW